MKLGLAQMARIEWSMLKAVRAHAGISRVELARAIAEVLPGAADQLLAIVLGVPGLIDPARGLGLSYKYLRGWREVPLVAPLARRFRVPVYLENNVRSMALAEMWFGHLSIPGHHQPADERGGGLPGARQFKRRRDRLSICFLSAAAERH